MAQPCLQHHPMGMHFMLPIEVNAADVDRRQVVFFFRSTKNNGMLFWQRPPVVAWFAVSFDEGCEPSGAL